MRKIIPTFIIRHWEIIILFLLIFGYIGTFCTLSLQRHNAFASRYDLSNMDQTIWYTLHNHFFQFRHPDNFVSRFSIHADLILVLLSPVYLLWNDVRAILVIQTVMLAIGAIPVYFISMRLLKNKIISLTIVISYLLNPTMQWTNIYDFHGVSFAIPFILSAFYFALIKRWGWYSIFVFLALITKEEISLNIAMMGIAIIFYMKNWKMGFVTVLIGFGWFFTMVFGVMPYFTPGGVHWALEKMGTENSNQLPQYILQLLKAKQLVQTFIFNPTTIEYYQLLLKPFAYLPILGIPWIFLSAPEIAINIIRKTDMITFHYGSGITPALVIATIFGIYAISYTLRRITFLRQYYLPILYSITAILLFIAIRVNYHYSPLPTTPSCSCYIYNVTQEDKDFEKILQNIPKDASITSSIEIRPHVSHREFAFTVPSATQSATYIALITENRIISNYNPKDYELTLISQLLKDTDHHSLVYKSEHFYLFQKI